MKVKAIRTGFYPNAEHINGVLHLNWMRRREGDVFELFEYEVAVIDPKTQRRPVDKEGNPVGPASRVLTVEEQFSERWMEKVDDDEPVQTTGAQAALNRETNNLRRNRKSA